MAARLAISDRCRLESLSARARPPFGPPLLPSADMTLRTSSSEGIDVARPDWASAYAVGFGSSSSWSGGTFRLGIAYVRTRCLNGSRITSHCPSMSPSFSSAMQHVPCRLSQSGWTISGDRRYRRPMPLSLNLARAAPGAPCRSRPSIAATPRSSRAR